MTKKNYNLKNTLPSKEIRANMIPKSILKIPK